MGCKGFGAKIIEDDVSLPQIESLISTQAVMILQVDQTAIEYLTKIENPKLIKDIASEYIIAVESGNTEPVKEFVEKNAALKDRVEKESVPKPLSVAENAFSIAAGMGKNMKPFLLVVDPLQRKAEVMAQIRSTQPKIAAHKGI